MKYTTSLLCAILSGGGAAFAGGAIPNDFTKGTLSPGEILTQLRVEAGKMPSFSAAAELAPVADFQQAPPDRPAYEEEFIDAFHRVEADLLQWEQRYRQAPGGSWEESEADRLRRSAAARGQELLTRSASLEYSSSEAVENLAKECSQKYQAASSGSVPESFYRSFIPAAWDGFERSAKRELLAAGHWRTLIGEAQRFEQRYQAAPSGSQEESAFRNLRAFAWESAPKVLERQLSWARRSFRDFEAMAGEFDAGYQAAPSGSSSETFYNQARTMAYDAALREAGRTFAWDHRPERLYPLDQEYDAKYQAASSGSKAESYFRSVRDLIRQYLSQPN